MTDSLDTKLERMRAALREMGSVAVAFSAGTDSTFVLKVALDVLGRENVVAVTGRSASVPQDELEDARRLAATIGAEHVIRDTDEFENENYTSNPTNRCYYCKTTLYGHIENLVTERGINWIVNGANADDLTDWRPGLKAAAEFRVASPASDAGLTKHDIRVLSERMGLPTFDKPASPCLSSRIPYGQAVTPEKLRAVESGEKFLKQEFSLKECRVRHHGDFARLEAPTDSIATLTAPENLERIESHFRALGFARVEVDPRGFRSGSLNEVIAFGSRQQGASQPAAAPRQI
jgi:uncharacterized protein